jgi:hypothetical protein
VTGLAKAHAGRPSLNELELELEWRLELELVCSSEMLD